MAEAKLFLKVENVIEDDLLSALVTASYEQICAETNRDFIQASYTQVFVSGSVEFLTSQYVDTVNTGSVYNRADGAYITFDDVYTGDVTYTVETGSTAIPQNVKVAQMMLISHWFENRGPYAVGVSAAPLDFTITALLSPYKIVRP